MSKVSFLNKYRPTDIENVIGNKTSINKFSKWISNFEKDNHSCIIISGNNGIGKTLISQLLLKKYNYKYHIIYPDEIKQYKQNNNFHEFFNSNNSVVNKIYNEKNNTALIFNDTEYITIKGEKLFITNLIKQNKNIVPIIFICNNNHSKLLNDIKKLCNEIKFYPPSSLELTNYIKMICKNEKIKIDSDPNTINKLIELSQYDIRRLLNLIQDFSTNYNKLNYKNIEKFCNRTIKKNVNYGLYDSTFLLLNKQIPISELYRFYENEKVLLPLMIQENVHKKIINDNTVKLENVINDLVNISDSVSQGDIIETSIYTDQNWCLQDIHGFYTCIYPSKISTKYKKQLLKSNIDFSSDLNKTSIKNINKKNINNLQKIIGCKSINEILLLSNLTNYCFEENLMEQFLLLLKSYSDNLDIKDIELCLKINKTIEFNTLNTKEKKFISNLL
jgi:DNA polymerase III delta prime subunit/uncharacterized protein YdcH (DUF465 family)